MGSYSVLMPSDVSASADAFAAKLTTNKAAFESTMETSYAAAFEKNTGSKPVGFTGVKAEDAGTKTVTVAPATTQAPPGTSAPAPAPSAKPTPGPTTPAPGPPAEEE